MHKDCRKKLSFSKKHSRTTDTEGRTLRSVESTSFDFKVSYFLCGDKVLDASNGVSEVTTLILQDMLKDVANSREDNLGG